MTDLSPLERLVERRLETALGVAAAERRAAAERQAAAAYRDNPSPEDEATAVDHRTARRIYASAALTGILASTEEGASFLKPAILAPLALAYADALIAAERQNGDPA